MSIRVVKTLKVLISFSPRNSRIFRGYSQSNLEFFWQPSASNILVIFLWYALRILVWPSTSDRSPSFSPRILRICESYPQAKHFENPWKTSDFLSIFIAFCLIFSRIFEKFSKKLKNLALILTSNFETLWGWERQILKIDWPLSPQRFSKSFKMTTLIFENSQSSRMRMRILMWWGLVLPP